MNLPPNQRGDGQLARTCKTASGGRDRGRLWRAGAVLVALAGAGLGVAACGASPSSHAVAHIGKTTTTGPSASQGPSSANASSNAVAFVRCMRAHGDTAMPDPVISGHHVSINVDPNAPGFTAAYGACRHLLPNNGVPRNPITPADQADYLKAAACMRSHGVPDFPDPVFKNGSVDFRSPSHIDTSSPQYKSAVAHCQKLIPKGLPYSGSPGS